MKIKNYIGTTCQNETREFQGSWHETLATCEDGLTFEDFGESSSCNSIVNKSSIAYFQSAIRTFWGKWAQKFNT